MSLTSITVEQLAEWCAKSEDIADIRAKARADFFGHREPEPANYVADTGSINSRKRRFLGWFVFSLKLSDARHPAELAANALLKEPELGSALRAIRNARYITAVVTGITHGRAFYLKLEDEDFEVNGPALSHILQRGQIVSAHILPARHDQWLLAPGWLTWPILPGPGLRSQLKAFQPDPVEVERFLQGRVKTPEELQKDEQ
ncbi:MAG: hypothetical protein U9Q17_04285, partial [Chloroflexota bacterium]|nr:hypothetical protein [Chloroflexota bacterium]